MQVTVESTGTLARRMTVALPAERLEQAFDERIRTLSKRVKVPGFRPGKVPRKMVEAQYGREVLEEATNELIRSTFYEAVGKQGLKPAGGPSIATKSAVRGHALEYTADFEVYPEVKKLDLAGIAVERPVCEIADADVERTLETMRRQRVSWTDVDRAARTGDRVIIDFVGRINGEPFEGGAAKGFELVLGDGQLIPGFEDGLAGVRVGEQRTLRITFPERYQNTQVAGKDADFVVDVKNIQEGVLPPIDEAFARALGIEDGSVGRLREEVAAGLRREAEQRIRRLVKERVFQALRDANPGDVPNVLVEQEAAHLAEVARANLGQQGGGQLAPEDEARLQERARGRVALGIILAEVVRQRGLRVDPARVRSRLEELSKAYERPEEFIQWHYERAERLAEIESAVLEDQVVELLLQSAVVEERPVVFTELSVA
ncbi:MAG: trigger factor [Acidiferrobacteraceae bacterium]